MLIDTHCHIDAYPQPAHALALAQEAGVRTLAVSTSLISFARSRIIARHHPDVLLGLGLHPRRAGSGYDQWQEWLQMLETATVVGEVGLDFRTGKEDNWAAQARTLAEIADACQGSSRIVVVHSHFAEAEAYDIIRSRDLKHVIWHDYRPEGPKSLLYRMVMAGHYIAVGPDAITSGTVRSRLKALPREQILTETNGPWGRAGAGERVKPLREVLAALADAWRCVPEEAEAQVERNMNRLLTAAGIGQEQTVVDDAAPAV
ncbi:MAG: TatD family hydrolase [Anaerolineae bacterium]